MAEGRTVVLGYRAPVYVTVDVDAEKVTRVDIADSEVEAEEAGGRRPYVVDFDGFDGGEGPFTDDEHAEAVRLADNEIWPAWRFV